VISIIREAERHDPGLLAHCVDSEVSDLCSIRRGPDFERQTTPTDRLAHEGMDQPALETQHSAVGEVGALSDLDDISVRIADVAARLAVLGDRLRDEIRSPAFP
jgi:hypothetical protein